jgi:ABC-type Fe3+ transport system permease subunit
VAYKRWTSRMGSLNAALFVLGMIYVAVIVLAIRDRMAPQREFVPQAPRITQHPNFRTIRWYVLPIWLPIALFSLTIYGVVFLPVILWRGTLKLTSRRTSRCN